jgi:hypothetical protein
LEAISRVLFDRSEQANAMSASAIMRSARLQLTRSVFLVSCPARCMRKAVPELGFEKRGTLPNQRLLDTLFADPLN